ncbi:hypothetical protein AVEN_125376-1 [Araneus ventricosus]|uniref:Uncharacterized protein n=1 Tax=Araneus ventricosus TaxID=182803 RepID=A0A4Y2FXV8_ARAVE|nr:hypothetical protein AVEN_125376-1 [Araneus ventricosus]
MVLAPASRYATVQHEAFVEEIPKNSLLTLIFYNFSFEPRLTISEVPLLINVLYEDAIDFTLFIPNTAEHPPQHAKASEVHSHHEVHIAM